MFMVCQKIFGFIARRNVDINIILFFPPPLILAKNNWFDIGLILKGYISATGKWILLEDNTTLDFPYSFIWLFIWDIKNKIVLLPLLLGYWKQKSLFFPSLFLILFYLFFCFSSVLFMLTTEKDKMWGNFIGIIQGSA